jgi:PAS domain S-box-containing protein
MDGEADQSPADGQAFGFRDRWLRSAAATVSAAVAVCAFSFAGATIGNAISFAGAGPAILFPPYAVLTAALLFAPPRTWWIFLLASSLGNFFPHREGAPASKVLLAELSNYTKALIAAGGIRFLAPAGLRLDTLRGMGAFLLFAVALGPMISALIGGQIVVSYGGMSDYWLAWLCWFLSNAVTGITLLTAIISVVDAARRGELRSPSSLRRALEAAALAVGLTATGIYVFTHLGARGGGVLPPSLLYAPLPFVLWASIRFGPAGVSACALGITVMAIWGVVSGRGPFVSESPTVNVLKLQIFLIATSLPYLLLSSLVQQQSQTVSAVRREVAQRQHADASLRDSEARYRAVVESQTEMVCRYLPDTTLTFVNDAYCKYFGRTREELLGRKFLELIPEPARDEALRHVQSLLGNPRVRTVEHEVLKPDGSIGWQQWVDYLIVEGDGRAREFQATGQDVTERKRVEESLRASEAALRQSMGRVRELAARLIEAQEAERTRIAMELHDGLSQRLAALSMGLSALKSHLGGEGLEQLARLQSATVALANEIRGLSHELHPGALRHAGLAAALRANCRELNGRDGVEIAFAGDDDLPPLAPGVSLCLYRVAQEALHNVIRHAQAKHAGVILGKDDGRLRLTVWDDGRGFDPEAARASDGVGLASMEERVNVLRGTIDIDAHPGRGTEVRVEIPFKEAGGT